MVEEKVIVHCGDTVEEFDISLGMTLKDIRSHFGVSGGSLKVEGKIKVAKEDAIAPPGTYVLDVPQTNQVVSNPGFSTDKQEPEKPPPGKRWFMKHRDQAFVQEIPIFIDFNSALHRVSELLKDKSLENWGIVIFDVPGAGKSTVIKRAAEETSTAYVRLRAGVGLMQSLVDALNVKCDTFPPEMACETLLEGLSTVVVSWLAKIVDKCTTSMRTSQKLYNGVLAANGPAPEIKMDLLRDRILELIQVVSDITPGGSFLLHVDDAQVLSSHIDFRRSRGVAIIPRSEFKEYYMICVSCAFENLREVSPYFKVAVSGTNVFQDRFIRLGSEWKCRLIDLGEIPTSVASQIFENYFDLQDFSERQRAKIYEDTSYNGRSILFTLNEFRHLSINKTTDQVSFPQVEAAIQKAYVEWVSMLTNRLASQNLSSGTYRLMNELLLLFAFPEVYGATPNPTHSGAVSIPVATFPKSWENCSNSIFRIQTTRDQVDIFRLKGFLARYQNEQLATRRWDSDILMLFNSVLSLSYEAIGSKGHLFERMIALELTMPNSPFTKLVCSKIGEFVLPDPRSTLQPIRFLSVIDDLVNPGHSVYCVVDDSQASGARKIDVAFPAVLHVPTALATASIFAVGEVKAGYPHSELWRLCYDFFRFEFRNRSTSPRIFFSLDKFTHTTVEQRKKRKPEDSSKADKKTTPKISGHDAREAVIAYLKEKSVDGQAKYIIVESPDFDHCVTPIKDLVALRLSNQTIELYPNEARQINADTLLSEFVPAVIEAHKTKQPRKKLVAKQFGRTDSMEYE